MSPCKIRLYEVLGVAIFLGLWALVAIVTGSSIVVAGVGTGVGVFVFFGVVILLAQFMNLGGRGERDAAVQREAHAIALRALPTASRGVRLVGLAFFIALALAALVLRRWEALAVGLGFTALFAFQLRHELLSGRT
jgi:hypothetical protein